MSSPFDYQSLSFRIPAGWTIADAVKWAETYGFTVKKNAVARVGEEIRIKLRPVSQFSPGTMTESRLGKGIYAVAGIPKGARTKDAAAIRRIMKATEKLRANRARPKPKKRANRSAAQLRETLVGRGPDREMKIELDSLRIPKRLALLGEVPRLDYLAAKDQHDGKMAHYFHEFEKMPIAAIFPNKRAILLVMPRGGVFNITEDGLED